MAMDFVMGEQVPKKSPTCPVSFSMSLAELGTETSLYI